MSIALATDGYSVAGAGANDDTAPTLSIVSPTPGVPVGQPGGFPSSYQQAKDTEIVLEVADADPGIAYFVVVARFYKSAEEDDPDESVIYRRGQFRGKYRKLSRVELIANGLRLHVRKRDGWPSRDDSSEPAHIVFAIDALDGAGNVAA